MFVFRQENCALVLPQLTKFCEICENREQFRWIKNAMTKLHESVHAENAVCHKVSAKLTQNEKFTFKCSPSFQAYHLLSLQIVFDYGTIDERTESIVHDNQWLLEKFTFICSDGRTAGFALLA